MLGMRESFESWQALGRDRIVRGLGAPTLIVARIRIARTPAFGSKRHWGDSRTCGGMKNPESRNVATALHAASEGTRRRAPSRNGSARQGADIALTSVVRRRCEWSSNLAG
jgi:hypothetical protein